MLSSTVVCPGYKQDFSLTETGGKLKRGKIIKILNEGWWQYWQAKVASKKEESEHEGDETPPEKPVREVHRGPLGCYLRTPWKLFRNHFGTTSVALGDYFWITLRATSWLLGGRAWRPIWRVSQVFQTSGWSRNFSSPFSSPFGLGQAHHI